MTPITSGVTDDEILTVFLTMLNDSFRSFVHVITWLKELFVQIPEYLGITLVGLAQYATRYRAVDLQSSWQSWR
jgi:hypothetical protein